jgi:hypothetical protein
MPIDILQSRGLAPQLYMVFVQHDFHHVVTLIETQRFQRKF